MDPSSETTLTESEIILAKFAEDYIQEQANLGITITNSSCVAWCYAYSVYIQGCELSDEDKSNIYNRSGIYEIIFDISNGVVNYTTIYMKDKFSSDLCFMDWIVKKKSQ